ncbi:YgaP family membrane protein [Estrella lausannensis]|uniref:Conserved putative secreted protein n=1 Tax=Estrella lausannensis TaxID=483423 RepID=A0A0H5E4R9_9BACT|nr:DUF2892 domain-containing protein [Estrella lausannensis]CRX38240.1 Conserved putative secreted protein [Estrella lausannensis]
MFKRNIDTKGRLIRLLFAILLLGYAVWQKSWIALAFSLFTFVEVAFSWCVLYQIFGWNSCPISVSKSKTPSENDANKR